MEYKQMGEPSVAASLHINADTRAPKRHWLAKIDLHFEYRRQRTVMVDCAHTGPLRVQRPFFPESDGTTHVYVLHPPGGIAVGDELYISARLNVGTSVVFTTPSAGKFYGIKDADQEGLTSQVQRVHLCVDNNACCEWLPQETIIFDSARAELHTRIELTGDAQFFGWDIVRFGRAASGEQFLTGSCTQSMEILHNGRLLFVERFPFLAGSDMQSARWGLNSHNTLATCVATVSLNRQQIDDILAELHALTHAPECWGLTQKKAIFIARYLGSSMHDCRKGMNMIWSAIRKLMCGKASVIPRIWHT